MSIERCNYLLWLAWALYWFWASRSVKKTKSQESLWRRAQHTVPSAIGVLFLIHRDSGWIYGDLGWSPEIQYVGFVMTALGVGFACWGRVHLGRNWSATVTLKEDHKLVQTGPYKWVRHPLYSGLLFAVLGTALVNQSGDAILGFVILTGTYVLKLKREEELLGSTFASEYEAYKKRVAALVPYIY